MTTFLIALAVLIGGYFTYGVFVERVFRIDPKRLTPVSRLADGVDYVPMATWRVFLVQFLNIAGIGPIFGAIMGVMYGPAAFLWIVLGTIFAGAVHDFISAMMSLRNDGRSLPDIVGMELGAKAKAAMGVFSCFLLLMVVAVFVRTPAALLASLTPEHLNVTFWAIVIFAYYVMATLLPVDKLIGKLYPLFGFALLFMAVGISAVMIFSGIEIPVDWAGGLGDRMPNPSETPVFPMLFVSIACGAISGFHATQSPMMARCLKNERHARPVFYGAMVAEGVVALVWAAAAIAFCGSYQGLQQFMADHNNDAGALVSEICNNWLGLLGGVLAILGVIAAPITTGDTAMRSARLIIADAFGINQKPILKRLLVAAPIIAGCLFLMEIDFTVLWRYFAWSNQSLAVFTLWAATVYLARNGRLYIITLVPALFMTVVCTTYILFAPLGVPMPGIGFPLEYAQGAGILLAAILLAIFLVRRPRLEPSAA